MSLVLFTVRGGGTGSVGPLTVVASPDSVYGFNYGIGTVVSDAVVLDISGGTPPYTVNWTLVSGSVAIYPTDDDGEVTYFAADINNTLVSGVWKAVVTDGAATVVDSNNVNITLESVNYPGGVIIA